MLECGRRPDLDALGDGERADLEYDVFAPHERAREHREGRHEPDADDEAPQTTLSRDGQRLQRPADGVEALGADDGEREDARRHRQTLAEVDEATHDIAIDPVLVDLYGDTERHAHEDNHQVAHGQVDEERVGDGAHVATPGEYVDDEDITDAAEEEGNAVEGDEDCSRRLTVHHEVLPDAPQDLIGNPRAVIVGACHVHGVVVVQVHRGVIPHVRCLHHASVVGDVTTRFISQKQRLTVKLLRLIAGDQSNLR